MNFYKTEHFLLRQWERCIDDWNLRKVLSELPIRFNQTTHVFGGCKWLKKLGIKAKPYAALVLIIGQSNTLVTLFVADDFWTYMQTSSIESAYFI